MNWKGIAKRLWKHLDKVGGCLLGIGLVLFFCGLHVTSLVALALVGIVDVVIVLRQGRTISVWLHTRFGKVPDYGVMVFFLCFVAYHMGAPWLNGVLLGIIIGHLFWPVSGVHK